MLSTITSNVFWEEYSRPDAHGYRRFSRKKSCPGGGTDWRGCVEVGEEKGGPEEGVHVGGGGGGVARQGEVSIPKIICQEDHHIGKAVDEVVGKKEGDLKQN